VCSCNKNIELGIDSIGRIYHKQKSDLENHNKLCKRYINHKEYFEKGWKSEGDNIIASLNFNVLYKANSKKDNINGTTSQNSNTEVYKELKEIKETSKEVDANKEVNTNPKNNINQTNDIKQKDNINKDKNVKQKDKYAKSISLDLFVKHINIEAFKLSPKDKFDSLKKVYSISKNIHIKGFKDISLFDMFFRVNEYKTIPKYSSKFVYMFLDDIKKLDDEYMEIKCRYSIDKTFSFRVKSELIENIYLYKSIDKIKSPIVVSGFIHKTSKGFEFHNISMIKTDKNGAY
jgi:hypothetical protein